MNVPVTVRNAPGYEDEFTAAQRGSFGPFDGDINGDVIAILVTPDGAWHSIPERYVHKKVT